MSRGDQDGHANRRFWKDDPQWRTEFVECFRRLARRLQLGLGPRPNCTGEEMAWHLIIDAARALAGLIETSSARLMIES